MRVGRLALLWFVIGLVASQDADFTPVCNFGQSSGSPVPDLPDQFSFTIEGNLIERNSTAIMTEYYDGPGNRGRLEFGFNASSNIGIFDYDLGEIFLIPDFRTGDDCRVSPIADSRLVNFTFGVQNINGSVHIGSPSMFVEALRDDSITQYVGEDMVRGIPTQRWQACVNRENISYLIDYYFATEPWDYEGQGQKLDSTQMVPIQFTLNTTRISNGTIRNIYHIYTVVDFRAGPESIPDSLFRVPNGLACTGRFPGQPVPQIPQFFSASIEQVASGSPIPSVQTVREFYDVTHQLFRADYYNDGRQYGIRGPNSVIHDVSTSVQYLISTQVVNCSVISLDVAAPYLFDVTRNDDGSFQLVSPNNLFLRGNEFNYSYEGVSNIRGVDVDSWVSVRDFEWISDNVNLTDAVYEVFFTRPGWVYTTTHSINTDPVPWRIKVTGTFSYINFSSNATVQMDSTYEMDLFDFSTDEPPYDAFDISSCSAPEDFYTLILIIPGQERSIDFGQLRRNIRTSFTNYTGLRPLQIGNIQIVSENGTHIFVTFQVSNLTSLAKIDPATIVTAQQAVDYITSNTVGSQLPFQIQISPNVSVTPSLRVAGRGPAPTACNDSFCDCSVPLVDPDGTCSTPNCATPPDIPSYFSVTVQQIDQHTRPPSAETYKEFYDYDHSLFRFDTYYDGSFGGFAEPVSIIHDLNSSVQYVIGNQFHFCLAQPLQVSAPFFWDITTNDGGTLQLVSPNNIFFRGPNYNYTYQGATNVRGVDVDSWLSYRSFEQLAPAFNLSDVYYQVFFTRPGWSFPIVQSVTNQPVPWRIVINGTLSTVNRTDNSTYSYFSTFYMDLYEFSTDEPPYDAFDISSCSGPDDYYTVVLFIPGNETGIDFGQLRRNIRTSITNYTGLRPLQVGNIQIIRENGTHFDVTFQISNLSSLAQIDPLTNVTAQQAVDLITGGTTVGSNQLPFQIQISPGVTVTPTFFVLGRGPNVSRDRCMNNTNIPPSQPCNCSTSECNATQCQRYCSSQTNQTNTCNNATNITSRLSNGAVAGIAIALFILGILVGIILQLVLGLVVRWCRSNSGSFKIGDSVKYKKQEDDLKIT